MNIKRVTLFAMLAAMLLAVGIYSQTVPVKPIPKSGSLGIEHIVYSGDDLGYMVASTEYNKIEGYFAIRVNGKWIPIPINEPTLKELQ